MICIWFNEYLISIKFSVAFDSMQPNGGSKYFNVYWLIFVFFQPLFSSLQNINFE